MNVQLAAVVLVIIAARQFEEQVAESLIGAHAAVADRKRLLLPVFGG